MGKIRVLQSRAKKTDFFLTCMSSLLIIVYRCPQSWALRSFLKTLFLGPSLPATRAIDYLTASAIYRKRSEHLLEIRSVKDNIGGV